MTTHAPQPAVSPVPLMDIASGVYAFKTLALADELGLFTWLSGRSTSVEEFAARHGIEHRPAELLLTACASIGLLDQDSTGAYTNSLLAEQYLVEGRPHYFGGWIKVVNRHEYPAYEHLETSLRGNHPISWDVEKQESLFAPDDPIMVQTFWDGMYSLSRYTAGLLADAFDFGVVTRILDVGGGGAAFDIELCQRYPQLRATVFDLPFVCELTRKPVSDAGLDDRIDLVGGDFFADRLPADHDAVLLSNILHDWDEAAVGRILDACGKALPAGGYLLICESFVADDKTGPPLAALMSLNMLVETWGRNYTVAEYTGWLDAAGFDTTNFLRFDGLGANGVLVAHKR
ncbi:methyltransferase [Nocardia sp. BMG51109]|uniref:methyltransferase n=1 Tax=Nocardia sp. BMG51109 TaxID=1056816 RepID=UPI0018DD55E4|nr:methyltransferase [Nocardia sp. BMG51109]